MNHRLVSDPIEAMRLLESGETVEIALIDITLPGMNGMHLITAIDDVGTARACREKGACDYLVKPFSREDLVSCIQRALSRRRFVEDVPS